MKAFFQIQSDNISSSEFVNKIVVLVAKKKRTYMFQTICHQLAKPYVHSALQGIKHSIFLCEIYSTTNLAGGKDSQSLQLLRYIFESIVPHVVVYITGLDAINTHLVSD